MEFRTIWMLLFSILWFFIFFSIVGIIRCENCYQLVIRILRGWRPNQAHAQNDIGVVFHRRTDPENGRNIELLQENFVPESQRSHENTTACSSV